MPDDTRRLVDPTYAPTPRTVAFADGYPVLIVGRASVDELNRRLSAKGASPVGVDRFRPNILVAGAAPHGEDGWKRLVAPDMAFDIVKPCARCTIVAVDPARGVRRAEPLRTLSEYRRRDAKVFFGQNALHDRPGRLMLGAQMVPESRSEEL
jgi:uncharacterized protein